MTEATNILNNLGMTFTEVEASASRVEARIDLFERERELEPSIELDDGTTISRFQMVREAIVNPLANDEDVTWVVTEIDREAGEITMKVPTDWSKCMITFDEMQSDSYEPMTTEDGEPMWGY